MAKEKDLLEAIRQAQAAYHEKVDQLPAPQLAPFTEAIKVAQTAYQDYITRGTKACPECGSQPIGMRRGNGTYEIGCIQHRKTRRSVGDTREDAVEAWNADEMYVKPMETASPDEGEDLKAEA